MSKHTNARKSLKKTIRRLTRERERPAFDARQIDFRGKNGNWFRHFKNNRNGKIVVGMTEGDGYARWHDMDMAWDRFVESYLNGRVETHQRPLGPAPTKKKKKGRKE